MTTKLKYPILLLYAFVWGIFSVQAQDVEINVSAPKVVSVNERFRLVYTINQQASGFQQPDLSSFMFSGPSRGTQISQSYVNGKMQSTQQSSYTYVLQAEKAGKFTIPAAKFVIDGKAHPSKRVTIEVVAGEKSNGTAKKKQAEGQLSDDDIFVRVHLSKSSLYKDEPLVATVKIYTKASIAGFQDIKIPSFTGFWSQEIENPKHLKLERQNVGGKIYEVGLLRKNLLFPQRSGKITIDAVEVEAVVRYRTKPTSFWDDGVRQMTKKLRSKKVVVQVKSLPASKPASFTGAVGEFKITANLDKNKLKTNDALTLKVKISGSGNLRLIKAPNINFPPDFDVYDPKEKQNIKTTASGASGFKSFEYVLIPRHRGAFTIPAIEVAYFDPSTKKYSTLRTAAMPVEVEKGEGEETILSTTTVRNGTDEVKVIQRDIRYIKTDAIELSEKGDYFFGSIVYWLILLLTIVVYGGLVALKQQQIKQNKNVALLRTKRASKVSKKRLKIAREKMQNNEKEAFFEEILKATWGYLSDKFAIDIADLNKERIQAELEKRSIDSELIARLSKVIDTCEFARYAPVQDAEIGNTFDETSEIINTLENQL